MPAKTKLEDIKKESGYLRGPLPEDLLNGDDHFSEAGKQLLKFHGVYQQDNRDDRKGGRTYSFMVRTRVPGGRLTAAQYLAHDAIADAYGGGSLRITTRQCIQFHGILKGDLRTSINQINRSLVTTLGACGDVVRNVMSCPLPAQTDPVRQAVEEVSQEISNHLTPRTKAYHEIWVDGEQIYSNQDAEEPIYGKTYLPRKFKIAVAPPSDNCVDVYTQDIGLIAVEEGGALKGFNVLVGGGLGQTHKKPSTFPRLADPLVFVTRDEMLQVVEQIVCIQRDHGDRTDRRQARMKYLVHNWGVDRFRRELEQRLGYTLKPVAPMPPLKLELHLGWQEQADGTWLLGLSVENGRVTDTDSRRLKSGLRAIVETFGLDVRLTPNQDILLTGIRPEDRAAIDALLAEHHILLDGAYTKTRKFSMACPALPTCGLAIAEAERVLPSIIDEFEAELEDLGLGDETLTIRMTGCPNGCARPYVADIGFVGRSLDQYTVYLGGRSDGTRLNTMYQDLVPRDELLATVRPLFVLFQRDRHGDETFGDFCHRVGTDALHAFADSFTPELLPTNGTH